MPNGIGPNEFIKVTATDEQGKYEHIGRMIAIEENMVRFRLENGVVEIPEPEVISVTKCRRPKDWEDNRKHEVPESKPFVKQTVTRTKKGGPTKVDQIVDLLKGKSYTRKEAIAAIVAAGISTPAGASTHYNNAKSRL